LQGNYSRVLKAKGFTQIIDLETADIPIVGAGAVVSARFLRENAATVENVLRALIDGQSFILAPQNKAAVLKIMAAFLREKDPAALEDGYRILFANMSRKPLPSIRGLQNIKRLLALSSSKAGELKVEELIDDSFMRRFEGSGVLDRALAGSL
jgi:ABC-type nitrate/sulfonate/bicarbonate transport system substrate-binding protein